MLVYEAINKIDGMSYIGITKNELRDRVQKHKNASKTGTTNFYKAIRKFGFENFEWNIVEDNIKSIEEAQSREKFYIGLRGLENLYNQTVGGEGIHEETEETKIKKSIAMTGEKNPMFGVPGPNTVKTFTEEHKDKISKALMGIERPNMRGGKNHEAKKVKNITTGEVFDCIMDAARKYNIARQGIGKVCSGERKSAGGFKWEFVK